MKKVETEFEMTAKVHARTVGITLATQIACNHMMITAKPLAFIQTLQGHADAVENYILNGTLDLEKELKHGST